MRRRTTSIPINPMANGLGEGIAIERVSFTVESILNDGERSHRHDGHSFFLLEKGTVSIEIDFENYKVKAPALIYLHPDQVHQTTTSGDITVSSWSIVNEHLNPAYLAILEDITPAKPLTLREDTFSVLAEAVSLCLKLSERKNDKLYHFLLQDSCNALVALAASQYLEGDKLISKLSRFDIVSKDFRRLLEKNLLTDKSPAEYAQKLNISTSYLNECIKNTTGNSASHCIQQRVILEAKRLLCYSDMSVKEIAGSLGYDDYPYFSRLFTKVSGTTPLMFRHKNRV